MLTFIAITLIAICLPFIVIFFMEIQPDSSSSRIARAEGKKRTIFF